MFKALFFKASSLKKIRSITFIVWVLGRVEKMPLKGKKNVTTIYFCLKQISKCDTGFYIHFSRAFQNYSFQICSFAHKNVIGYLRFFYILWFFIALHPTLGIKKLPKNPLNFYLWKVKKTRGGSQMPPPVFRGRSSRSSLLFDLLWVTRHTLSCLW